MSYTLYMDTFERMCQLAKNLVRDSKLTEAKITAALNEAFSLGMYEIQKGR